MTTLQHAKCENFDVACVANMTEPRPPAELEPVPEPMRPFLPPGPIFRSHEAATWSSSFCIMLLAAKHLIWPYGVVIKRMADACRSRTKVWFCRVSTLLTALPHTRSNGLLRYPCGSRLTTGPAISPLRALPEELRALGDGRLVSNQTAFNIARIKF